MPADKGDIDIAKQLIDVQAEITTITTTIINKIINTIINTIITTIITSMIGGIEVHAPHRTHAAGLAARRHVWGSAHECVFVCVHV
jgi:hypothetical protein